jgi:hypothetical protein
MRFYYRIYQKTKVLTRKRKKKRTRATSGQHQPAAKKLRTLDLTALAWNGGSGSETTTASPAIGRSSGGGAAEAVTRMETDTTALPPTPAAATAVGASAALPAGLAAVSKSPEKGGGRPAEKAGASGDKRQPPATAADKTAAISDVRKPVKSGGVGPTAPAGGNKVIAAKPPVAAGPAVKGGKPEASTSVSVAPTAAAKSVTATTAMGNKAPAPQASGAAGGTKQGPAQVVSEVATKAPTTSAKPVPSALANKPVASVAKKPIVAADKGRESAGKVTKSSSSEAVFGDGDGVRKGDKPVQANGSHTTAAEAAASKKADQDNTVSKVTGQQQQQQVNNTNSSSSSNRGGDKTPSKLAVAEKKKSVSASPRPRDGKEVVEISVEVSASDVKKVLEKKRAEKDAAARLLLPAAGEERLYSNYSIVDQIKKAGTAASLARQQTERASMMDFARTSEALASAPRVPPILQGLQPRLPPPTTAAATEPPATTVLSAIVQNLAQKQQKAVSDAAAARASPLSVSALVKDTTAAAEASATAAGGKPLLSSEYAAAAAAAAKRTSPKPGSATDAATATKTLGAIVAPALSTAKGPSVTTTAAAATPTTAAAAASSVAALAPKLPGSTSIQAVSRDGKASPTAVETSGPAGQQMLSFYKSSFAKAAAANGGGLSEAVKSAESLTKNIPAGTTVTVKTIENKSGGGIGGGKSSPPSLSATPPTVPSPAPPPPSSPKNSAFRMNLSGSTTFHTGGSGSSSKTIANPYASMAAVSQASLINPFVHSTLRDSMTMALAAQQAQFLNFSNHQPFVGAAAALAAQMEAANFANNAVNYVRAAQQAAAAQRSSQSSSPMTTLEFTKAAASLSGHLADDRYGVLKIPQPGGRSSNPSGGGSLSSFGTNRLQVKVNPDGPAAQEGSRKSGSPPSAPYQVPATTSASDSSSPSQLMANGKHVGTHSMPAILPFHGVKKVQALPKTASHSSPRPVAGISSVMGGGNGGKSPLQQGSSPPASPLAFPKASPAVANAPGSPLLNTIQSLTDSNPFASSSGPTTTAAAAAISNNKNGGHPVFSSVQSFKAPPSSVGSVVSTAHSNLFNKTTNVNSGGQQQQPLPPAANNSLKKLAADLNTAQQKTLKGDNVILNALKKSGGNSGGKLSASSDFGGKGFGGKGGGGGEVKKVGETGGGGRKEVTTSS